MKVARTRPLSIILVLALVSLSRESIAGESGAKRFRHKYMFTQKKQKTTKCIRMVATALKALNNYKSCKAWKGSSAPLELTIARCEKSDGTMAYVFENLDDCTLAQSNIDGGDAT